MSSLDDAIKQLEAAVRRLETAVEGRMRAIRAARDQATERERLVADLEGELGNLRRDHAALEARTDLVATRLDAVIERLKGAMTQ